MNSVFQVCKYGECGFKITGLELTNNEYLADETKTSLKTYPFSQSVTLNALTTIKFDGTETIDKYGIVLHEAQIDEATYETSSDGLYKITHIILPTQVWLTLAESLNALGIYTNIYYYNTTTSKFMKYSDSSTQEVSINEILEINATDTTTIVRTDKNTFCLCRLQQCYYDKIANLLNILPTCKNNNNQDIYIRDLIWMGINAIKYCIDLGQYYKAQEILEEISGCRGLCSITSTSTNSNYIGCGCNK